MVPTGIHFGNNNDGEGSSSNPPTAFETVFYPNQNHIEVSPEFVNNWKDVLALHSYGAIKDPVDNFFEIETSCIVTECIIRPAVVISAHCGFIEPQKVILDYEPDFNQFSMRIIDNDGKDVPYYGFHYPVNHHAMKMADPNYKVNPQCISLVRKEGEMFLPIGFGMRWMNLQPVVNEQQPIEEEEFIVYPYEWDIDVSSATAQGKSVLHFPKWVARDAQLATVNYINLMNEETDETVQCKLKKSTRRPIEYFIGVGWYKFVLDLKLQMGDKLMFGLEEPPTMLHVGVVRQTQPHEEAPET